MSPARPQAAADLSSPDPGRSADRCPAKGWGLSFPLLCFKGVLTLVVIAPNACLEPPEGVGTKGTQSLTPGVALGLDRSVPSGSG